MSTRARALAFLFLLPWGIASLSGVPVEPDARKIDPVLLHGDLLGVPPPLGAAPLAPAREGIPLVPVFIKTESGGTDLEGRIRTLGGDALRVSEQICVAQVPPDSIRYISLWESVRYIEGGRIARAMLDISRSDVFADVVHTGAGPALPRGFTGAGINIGIVDSGLDNTHRDFRDSQNTTRVIHTYPAILPIADPDGHGTHVAGIAAGNGLSSNGTYTGMAPGSDLLIGKTNFLTTDIVLAVNDLMNASAAPPATPIAVNLSLGLMKGPHDGTDAPLGSLFSQAINDLGTHPPGGRGIIVVAAGNELNEEEHFQQGILPSFGAVTIPLKDLRVPPGATGIEVAIWAEGEDRYSVTVTMGSPVTAPSGTIASTTGISIFNRTDAPVNGATHITVILAPPAGTTTATIRLERTRNGGTGKIDAYLDSFFSSSSGITHNTFQNSTGAGTIIEPANGENVIAVGSYNSKSGPFSTGALGSISTFSSLGPTRDGRTKPDLAAPGSFLWSTRSFDAPDTNYFGVVPGNDNYAILAGTSMAAPHVAGIAALVWESNPSLTGAQMRARLKHTADPPPGAPDNTWGHGKVNALRAVTESVASITAPAAALPGSVVTATSENSSGAFGDPLTGYTWVLTPLPSGPPTPLSASDTATFSAPTTPGNYRIDLTVSQSAPASTPAGSTTSILHVNHPPDNVLISGPSSADNTAPALFQGSSTDPDAGPPATFRWVLVTRPSGSAAAISPITGSGTTLIPDLAGTYEIGLRADDGLDNSALVTKTYTVGPVSTGSGGGGGGGCSVPPAGGADRSAPPSGPVLLLLPLAVLGVFRNAGERIGRRNR